MSTTAKRKKGPESELRRPFSPGILRRARAIAGRYQIVLWRQDGRWFGRGMEEPWTFGDTKTIEAAVRDTHKGLVAAFASNIEHGEPVVTPIVDQERRRRKAG